MAPRSIDFPSFMGLLERDVVFGFIHFGYARECAVQGFHAIAIFSFFCLAASVCLTVRNQMLRGTVLDRFTGQIYEHC